MPDETLRFALACRDPHAPAPVLVNVQADGRLDAVLFELTLRQTYRNTSDRVLEVVYTFPLPCQAVLLGFASELNGARQEGRIVARRDAERRYEDSLAEGDAPVMLEMLDDGLHTANIGNLAPGDEIVLECRFAQLLAFEQGRLRVAIPTTIAPRYGSADATGLQPQQVPQASLEADHPLALSLVVGASWAGAALECPTHRIELVPGADGATRMRLAPGARLDRDVVLVVTPREPRPSLLVRAHDAVDADAPVVMMAALQPPAGVAREGIALKLLVDCSGSMSGDSIASARAALRGVVDGLGEQDHVSLSRFGSTVEQVVASVAARPQALRHLRAVVDGIEADLGGTELQGALTAVFGLPRRGAPGGGDVLLITDGEVWQAEEMIAAARASGHRVFAIGVGTAPAEGVLRSLAEATGGACEFATPGEALEAAAQRMLRRIRQQPYRHARVDWGRAPAWQQGPASVVFGGDTVIAWAAFREPIDARSVRLLADDADGRVVELARAEADAPCPGDSLPRIAAACRLRRDEALDALTVAVQYQLMSTLTHCILVHQREAADQTVAPAELHRVDSMLAAGWGGFGSEPLYGATPSLQTMAMVDCCSMGDMLGDVKFSALAEPLELPTSLRKVGAVAEPDTLETLARRVVDHLRSGDPLETLAVARAGAALHGDVTIALDEAVAQGPSVEQAWVMLADWVLARSGDPRDGEARAFLRPTLDTLDVGLLAAVTEGFERTLGLYPNDGWTTSRRQRLAQALGRLGA